MYSKTARQIKVGLSILVSTILFGSIGYMIIENWSFFDSLYMTIITITTTGFREVNPLSDFGRAFTILIIVLGFGSLAYIGGKMGRYICDELVEENAKFVVIENDQEKIDKLIELGYLFVNGDATHDQDLQTAGVQRAKGLVAVLVNDAENVLATLSAKVLNPNIYVVARAVEEETESKLIKAGANRVVKPYEIGGTRMAELLLRPGVVEFMI